MKRHLFLQNVCRRQLSLLKSDEIAAESAVLEP
ncbi:hypothetical protein T4E_3400 [Trichinella pseudospiralis]|uniref:Uncharacterized protein n=1 Tax=Trichinella pseudospiralis TaxID=6337 RepID=A0A0V0WJS3_TRIPS|nr:hypothetical protein T4E_3400 [Trichinella pseudospiralis]